jgi:hypothetical protein
MTNPPEPLPQSEIVFYQTEDGQTRIQVRLEEETAWLTQADMASLFQTTPQNITLHLGNIFQERELNESSTCKDLLQVQEEGGRMVRRSRRYYNLDAAIERARGQYEKYRRQLLQAPSPVELHFIEAVKEMQLLEKSKTTDSRKSKGGVTGRLPDSPSRKKSS